MKVKVITLVLLGLWIPALTDKVLGFEVFQNSLKRQPFPDHLAQPLGYFLVLAESITVVLLITAKCRRYGLFVSLVLLTVFTAYIAAALAGAWADLPCGCGSVISTLSWTQHFWFNLFFLLLSLWGILLMNKNRGGAAGGETA
jgi:putative oxidoreductase